MLLFARVGDGNMNQEGYNNQKVVQWTANVSKEFDAKVRKFLETSELCRRNNMDLWGLVKQAMTCYAMQKVQQDISNDLRASGTTQDELDQFLKEALEWARTHKDNGENDQLQKAMA